MGNAFDISDAARNRYADCPFCNRDFGMGLHRRGGQLAVVCDCGHEGPWVAGTPPGPESDMQAFNAWNRAALVLSGIYAGACLVPIK